MGQTHSNKLRRSLTDPRDHRVGGRHLHLLGDGKPFVVAPLTAGIPAFDQGQISDCLCNALVRLAMHRERVSNPGAVEKSRLFNYWFVRMAEGTTDQDCGGSLRDTFKAYNRYGLAPEADWPDDDATDVFTCPSHAAIADALPTKGASYGAVDVTIDGLKASLLAGFPIAFGMGCPPELEADGFDGELRSTAGGQDGHAMVIDGGQDDETWPGGGWFSAVNSWGPGWGQAGRFKMSYAVALTIWESWQLTAGN